MEIVYISLDRNSYAFLVTLDIVTLQIPISFWGWHLYRNKKDIN